MATALGELALAFIRIAQKRLSVISLLLTVMTLAVKRPAAAQGEGSDAQQIAAVVARLFDAMRAGDSATVRAVFDSTAQLIAVDTRQNPPTITVRPVEAFIKGVGTPHAEQWNERPMNPVTHIDGPLAVVWTDYTFHLGERFSHCGVDTFQLVRRVDGWKILSIAYTRRVDGCDSLKR
jgi:hypothetical protein